MPPADYTATSGTLSFAPGETSKIVTVLVAGDTAVELDETLAVTLSPPTTRRLAMTAAPGPSPTTILPALSITGAVGVAEGNSGTTPAVFTVSLSAAASQTVTVNYATAAGTAVLGTDVTATSGTLTFLAGETTKTVNVDVIGDTLFEGGETFTVVLSGPGRRHYYVRSRHGHDQQRRHGAGAEHLESGRRGRERRRHGGHLHRHPSAASGLPATASYATSPGTASAGADFTAASNTVTVAAGSTSAAVTVTVAGETLFEADETFSVTLSAPGNATLGGAHRRRRPSPTTTPRRQSASTTSR